MPLWRPHYINRLGTMRAIVEPRRLLGPASDGTLVASREWAALAPPRTLNALHRVHLGLDAVAEMDRLVNVEKMTPRDAARAWMQMNRDQVETWFAGF
jgi:glycine betaine/proline transport system substrate-binding protein